ncbi:MAG TPA: sigma-70 family RNA polymerase sigma factor [Candidatus Dormibacteraeota bacterium]|nr:sigma-70 family RNA polymerase sigma factor [Candidatus Dormibacteraeota bacterium]
MKPPIPSLGSYRLMHAETLVEPRAQTRILDPRAVSTSEGMHGLAAGQLGHLVLQATGGDLDAFEELIRRLQRRVYGFAYQHVRDSEEAHDLAQEIFVKLYRNLARYDAERPFEPWFWKLAANTSINYRRKRVPMPAEATDEAVDEEAEKLPRHDPALVDALAQLDPGYRLPVLLHYYADLSVEQVSLSLNVSVAAVKSRLHRARAQLRNSLAEAEERAEP